MTRHFAAAMRRANKLMRPPRLKKATRTAQKAIAGLMVDAMVSALPAAKPKKAAVRRTVGVKSAGHLGSVVAQLLAAKPPKAATTNHSAPDWTMRTHRTAAGARNYSVYLPAGHAKQPKGLVLMLHGCNQSPNDFALGTRMNSHADKNGLVIVYPAQTTADNAAACWNWFRPDNQARSGEAALLASLTRKLMKEYGLSRESVFVAGLSAGGAMAAILADVYPDVFSAAGIHSGLARGSARDVMSAMSAMRSGSASSATAVVGAPQGRTARRIVFHGDKDNTVHPSNAAKIVADAMGNTAIPQNVTRRFVRGRGYARNNFADANGQVQLELWMIEGAGHAWSGGHSAGSFTDANGPDASAQMIRFFVQSGN